MLLGFDHPHFLAATFLPRAAALGFASVNYRAGRSAGAGLEFGDEFKPRQLAVRGL